MTPGLIEYARQRTMHYGYRTIVYIRMGHEDSAYELARVTFRWAEQAGLITRS